MKKITKTIGIITLAAAVIGVGMKLFNENKKSPLNTDDFEDEKTCRFEEEIRNILHSKK